MKYFIIMVFVSMFFCSWSSTGGIDVQRASHLDISLENVIGNNTITLVSDNYAESPTLYVSGDTPGEDTRRNIGRILNPLNSPQIEVFATVPVFLGEGPEYTEGDWGEYSYLTGLTTSEEYVFAGGNTGEVGGEDIGAYIVKYNKNTGDFLQLRKNEEAGNRISGLYYYQVDQPQTFYFNHENNWWALEPGEDITEYQADDALLATQVSKGVYAVNPEDITDAGTGDNHLDRNQRPNRWAQLGRNWCRDLIFDYELGDLFVSASGTSDSWEQGFFAQKSYPAYNAPGIIRQIGYDPFIPNVGDVYGWEDDEEGFIVLPAVEEEQPAQAWVGMDLYVYNTWERYLAVADYYNQRLYIYHVLIENEEVAPQLIFTMDTEGEQYTDVLFMENDEQVYLFATPIFDQVIHVYEVEFTPTFSGSWSLFQ